MALSILMIYLTRKWNSYLLDEEAVALKTRVWERLNADYLEKQAEKQRLQESRLQEGHSSRPRKRRKRSDRSRTGTGSAAQAVLNTVEHDKDLHALELFDRDKLKLLFESDADNNVIDVTSMHMSHTNDNDDDNDDDDDDDDDEVGQDDDNNDDDNDE